MTAGVARLLLWITVGLVVLDIVIAAQAVSLTSEVAVAVSARTFGRWPG